MDRQQILLAKTLEAAELPLSVKTFDERLILQKSVYLLQSYGIQFGYRFRWYLRGPYSPDMTGDAFGILNEGEYATKELEGWVLDATSAERARALRPLMVRDGESKAEQARRLELLASALFLYNTNQAPVEDAEKTSMILKRNQKHFEANEVAKANEELKAYGLLK